MRLIKLSCYFRSVQSWSREEQCEVLPIQRQHDHQRDPKVPELLGVHQSFRARQQIHQGSQMPRSGLGIPHRRASGQDNLQYPNRHQLDEQNCVSSNFWRYHSPTRGVRRGGLPQLWHREQSYKQSRVARLGLDMAGF